MQRSVVVRGAAVLALAVLAACDAPISAPNATEAPDELARHNVASTSLAVTNSGGHPLVSWTAVPGATSYTVRLVTILVFTHGSQRLRTDLATTTGTSYLDTSRFYTGDYSCPRYDEGIGSWTERYQYVVVSHLATGGTSMQSVDAPIGECY